MNPNMRILTVHSLGDTPDENYRVTLSAMSIKMVASQDGMVQDRPVKKTRILFEMGDPVELNLSDFDLMQIESVVGAYGFMED